VDCLITDHHLPSTEIPAALAVINPHLLPPQHPAASLPGVGVAFFFTQGVINCLESCAELDDLLDLVALGSIADMANLTADTRHYTKLGLQRMRSNPRPALTALFEKAEIDPLTLSEDDISRQIAPRLNAVGRVKDANELVEFLLYECLEDARIAATRYEQVYLERN
jgi:single-stranded-DNA-specific exonuclease